VKGNIFGQQGSTTLVDGIDDGVTPAAQSPDEHQVKVPVGGVADPVHVTCHYARSSPFSGPVNYCGKIS